MTADPSIAFWQRSIDVRTFSRADYPDADSILGPIPDRVGPHASAMARLRLRTFGGLSLEGTDGTNGTMPKGRRPLALLALLATSGSRGLSRDKVTALLWPESDAERGRNSLSQVLSSLRRELGPDDLVLGTAEIRLNADAIASDIEDFETSVARGDVERAVAIQSGPFLDGFYLTDAPEFERWVEEQRARLTEKQRGALQQLAVDADRRGDRAGAVSWWRRLVTLDPTSARAAVGLMEALAASGDAAAALRHFQVYTALLEQELRAEPDTAVVRLAERLRRGDGVTSRLQIGVPTSSPTTGTAAAVPAETVVTAIDSTLPPSRRRSRMNATYAVLALTVLVGAFMVLRASGVGSFATLLSSGRLAPNELLLVADFNATGADSVLSRPLAEMMRSGLRQSRVIEIAPSSRVATALQRMARAPDSRIDLGLAREIAQREGIKALVGGTLTPLPAGGGYLLSTQLLVASTGDELASFQETANGPKDLVPAVDRLSRKLRERIGESLSAIRADPPLAEVTTASLDALKKYSEALEVNATGNYSRAIALLDEAIGLDSNFAMAYRQLVVSINNSRGAHHGIGGEQTSPNARLLQLTERAYQLRDRLPERERLQTVSLYYATVLGDVRKAKATYEGLLSKYPRTPGGANFYATSYLLARREFARAESVYATLIAADTSAPLPYSNIVAAQIGQGKLVEARRSIERLERQFPKHPFGARARSGLQYALGHIDSSESILNGPDSGRSQSDRLYARNTLTAYALLRGQIAKVRPQLEQARALVIATGEQPFPLQDTMTVAQFQLVFFSRPEVAVRILDRALRDEPRESILQAQGAPYLRAASLYALAARPDRAHEMLALYDREVKDTAQRRLDDQERQWAVAHIDLALGRARIAAAEFRRADFRGRHSHLCAVCVDPDVGRAFDRAGMADSAIAAFEHFVNAPSVGREVADAWNLHWILRRLGELHEARGDCDAARTYYQRFVTLWTNADWELQPAVNDVRQRLSRLACGAGATKH